MTSTKTDMVRESGPQSPGRSEYGALSGKEDPVKKSKIFYTADELVEELGVTRRQFVDFVGTGYFPQPKMIGGNLRWPTETVQRWVVEHPDCSVSEFQAAIWGQWQDNIPFTSSDEGTDGCNE